MSGVIDLPCRFSRTLCDSRKTIRRYSKWSHQAPILPICIGGEKIKIDAIIDTGSAYSHIPADLAEVFNHDNKHPDVPRSSVGGFGGRSVCYGHTDKIDVYDEEWNLLWSTNKRWFRFSEGISNLDIIVLGRDVINRWKSFTIYMAKRNTYRFRIDF